MITSPPIQLASISMADSIILMILALVVFGPRKLPQIGRQIGKLMYEFRKASNDFKFQMEEELRMAEDADRRKKEEEERQRVAALPAPAQPTEGLAEQTKETAQASPYPGEEVYPPVILPEAEAASTEPQVAASQTIVLPRVGPVIQPPSTGETVAAAKPGAAATETQTASSETETPAPPISSDTQQTEPITHNG